MTQKTDTRTKLLTVPPFKLMLSLSIPAIIGMVVVGLYNFMDRVFVGQLINEVVMGAAGTNFGAKQYDRAKQVTRAFIIGASVIGLIFYIPIQLCPGTILSWFIKDKGIVSQGVTDYSFCTACNHSSENRRAWNKRCFSCSGSNGFDCFGFSYCNACRRIS